MIIIFFNRLILSYKNILKIMINRNDLLKIYNIDKYLKKGIFPRFALRYGPF